MRLAAVEAFVRQRLGGRAPTDLAPIGHGEWSQAFSFALPDGAYVVRFSAFDDDFAKDRLAAGYAADDLPIPAIVEHGRAFDGYYTIARRADGDYLDELDGTRLRRALVSLLGALDAVRNVDLSGTRGYGVWDARGVAPHPSWRAALLDVANDRPTDRITGWRDRLWASPIGPRPFEESFAQLEALVRACPEERSLVHADLLNYNVLVRDERVSGIIDWGNALYGDFVFDIAWLVFWSPWYPAWAGIDFAAEAARHWAAMGLEVPHLAERLRCCAIHIGLAGQAYNAYKGRWEALEATARRTLAFARN